MTVLPGSEERSRGAPGGDGDVAEGGSRDEADCGGAGDDEMAGATGGAVERSPWPPQDESDTAGTNWFPLLPFHHLHDDLSNDISADVFRHF